MREVGRNKTGIDFLPFPLTSCQCCCCCCCCCCQVASVVSGSVRPHSWQPARLLCLWDSPGKNTGVGCHCLLQCMKMKSESEVAQSCRLLATPWTAAYQAPPSMGLSRQECWSGLPSPSLEELPPSLIHPIQSAPRESHI